MKKCTKCKKKKALSAFSPSGRHDGYLRSYCKACASLCGTCNNGIGHFKDSINLIKKVLFYLEEYKGK